MTLLTLHFKDLFAQLGLENDDESIRQFIECHGPLDSSIALADAPFWSKTQSDFLREQLLADAEWAVLVDQLNTALHPEFPSVG